MQSPRAVYFASPLGEAANRVLDLIVSSGSVFSEAFGSYSCLVQCILQVRAAARTKLRIELSILEIVGATMVTNNRCSFE